MQSTYRGSAPDAAAYVNPNAYVGRNKGGLYNAAQTGYSLYKLYKALPPDVRYKWFGDKRALHEDQSSKNPMLVFRNGKWVDKYDDAENQAEELEAILDGDYELNDSEYRGDVIPRYEDYRYGRRAEPDSSLEEAYRASIDAENDYNEREARKPSMQEAYDNSRTKVSTKNDTARAYNPTKAEDGSKLDVKGWQKFLNDNGFTDAEGNAVAVDGQWGDKTQQAYDQYTSTLEENGEEWRPSEDLAIEAIPLESRSGYGSSDSFDIVDGKLETTTDWKSKEPSYGIDDGWAKNKWDEEEDAWR